MSRRSVKRSASPGFPSTHSSFSEGAMYTGDHQHTSASDVTREMVRGDPALLRGLTEARYSRRRFLRGAGLAAGALATSGLLSACGIKGTEAATGAPAFDWTAWWSRQKQHGVLNFANWPLYIDTNHGKHPTLEQFTAKTGIKVNYFEVIQDNAPFYAQIAPTLRAGQSIGYDIIVMTDNDWSTIELFRVNKWATPLEHGLIPYFFLNATEIARNRSVDPGHEFTI